MLHFVVIKSLNVDIHEHYNEYYVRFILYSGFILFSNEVPQLFLLLSCKIKFTLCYNVELRNKLTLKYDLLE